MIETPVNELRLMTAQNYPKLAVCFSPNGIRAMIFVLKVRIYDLNGFFTFLVDG